MIEEVADALVARHLGLVYGGGSVGSMGALADAVQARGGSVVGVIPRFMVDAEVAHHGLDELVIVDSMHARKAEMTRRSCAFLALPGGFGTLDELCEALTWAQLGLHQNPIGLLDHDGFFQPLLTFFDHLVSAGFVRPEDRSLILTARRAEDLVARLVPA